MKPVSWSVPFLLGVFFWACGPHVERAAASPATATSISIDGDPNGLFWDAALNRLIIADDANNRLLAWQEGRGVVVLADVPVDAGKPGLGQPVLDETRSIVVPRFGHGVAGAVIRIDAQGRSATIAGLDPKRRRIGLASSQGRLFETFFVKSGEHRQGGVAEILTSGTEVDVAAFHKPVGIVAVADVLYVSDQDDGAVFRCGSRAPASCTRFATLDGPDLLAVGPAGTLFTGGRAGQVRQIDRTGQVRAITSPSGEIRGIAWDGARRLFVARRGHDRHATIEIVPWSE